MPRKARIRRRAKVELTERERTNLICGPYHPHQHVPVFRDEAERREAWETHRDELIRLNFVKKPLGILCGSGKGFGTRPLAWWEFDAPEPLRDGETELEFLQRHNLLTPEEKEHFGGKA